MSIEPLVERLHRVFSSYPPGRVFGCTYCYSNEELKYFAETPLMEIPNDRLASMLGETGDHWESAEAYKHFLPRMLEVMGPPHFIEDIYPQHTFETLLYHGFQFWSEEEQSAVLDYLRVIENEIQFFDEEDHGEWKRGLAKISSPTSQLS